MGGNLLHQILWNPNVQCQLVILSNEAVLSILRRVGLEGNEGLFLRKVMLDVSGWLVERILDPARRDRGPSELICNL